MKLTRRHLLAGLAVGAVAPVAACVDDEPPAPPETTAPTSPSPSPSPTPLPFDLQTPSQVQALVFNGGFGTGYVRFAADLLEGLHDGVTVRVRSSQNVGTDLADAFEPGGTPPDLIDNSGGGSLPVAKMLDDFEELDDLLTEPGLDGDPIADTLYHGTVDAGTFNGRFVAVNYALSVYGLWHSASTFAAEGWALPTTWDDVLALGDEARRSGRHLFVWGDEAANYYQELAISSAIKEGGHEVRVALDNLEADSWAHPAVTMVLEAMEACVDEGFFLDGGPYLEAQRRWSRDGEALLYPSGSWIAKEMSDDAAEGFEFTVAPVPTLTAAPTLPITAIHSAPTEQFLVPKAADNPAGGKELLRMMLSSEAAAEFSRTNLIPTVVRGNVPSDVESSSLRSQTRLLADAGENVFDWRFVTHYGLKEPSNELWASFLGGEIRSAELAERLQELTDGVRNDPDVERYTVD